MAISFKIHFVLAILTLMVCAAAGCQALLLAWQERALRRQMHHRLLTWLPPLQSMEQGLFRLIALGFFLLTCLIISATYFYHQQLTVPLLQKALLAAIAWIIFAGLLAGRYYLGWRGRKAIYGTLSGVVVIVVIYFGSVLLLRYLL